MGIKPYIYMGIKPFKIKEMEILSCTKHQIQKKKNLLLLTLTQLFALQRNV